MAKIGSSDIKLRLTGGAANTNPALSLGGAPSNTDANTATLFRKITDAEALAGKILYRAVAVVNVTTLALALEAAKLWLTANTPSGTTNMKVGIDPAAVNTNSQVVANESTSPSGVTFVNAADKANGLQLPDLPGNSTNGFQIVWFEYTVDANTQAVNDSVAVRVEGATQATP